MNFNFASKKYSFTQGGEFTLSGKDYIGYFNLQNNNFYIGRDTTETQLLPEKVLNVDLYQSQYFKDRAIIDTLQLPYELDQVLLPPNEIVTNKIFTSHLKRLYDNNLYLYSRLFLANNNLPSGDTIWAGITSINTSTTGTILSASFKWFPPGYIAAAAPGYTIGLGEFDNILAWDVVNNKENDHYMFFAISTTHFILLTANEAASTLGVAFSSQFVDINSEQKYKLLKDICVTGEKLFIADEGLSYIYKYDLSGVLGRDYAIPRQLYLEEVIGGPGFVSDKNKFGQIKSIEASLDRIYVNDILHKCIKVYDENLSWINTFETRRDGNIVDISYNSFYDVVFVLRAIVGNLAGGSIWIMDKDCTKIFDEIQLSPNDLFLNEPIGSNPSTAIPSSTSSSGTETLRRIEFSKQDSNILYIVTDRGIYKKHISRLRANIGEWLFNKGAGQISTSNLWADSSITFNNLSINWGGERSSLDLSGLQNTQSIQNIQIIDFAIVESDDNFDKVFVIANLGEVFSARVGVDSRRPGRPIINNIYPKKILYSKEQTIYDSILADSKIASYLKAEINLSPDEYITAMSINKELYKLVFNIISIKNLIRGKFTGEFNIKDSLLYTGYEYINNESINFATIKNINDIYLHENEHITYHNINRPLKIIYDLQKNILDVTNTKIKNIKFSQSVPGTNMLLLP